jgi:hypothetical protein
MKVVLFGGAIECVKYLFCKSKRLRLLRKYLICFQFLRLANRITQYFHKFICLEKMMSDLSFAVSTAIASAGVGECIMDLAPNHADAAVSGFLAVAAALCACRAVARTIDNRAAQRPNGESRHGATRSPQF